MNSIVPAPMVRLWDLVHEGDHDGALAQHRALQPLNRFLEYDPGYVAPPIARGGHVLSIDQG